MARLGVNVDHVATLRQVRKEIIPDVLDACLEAVRGGAFGITAHLREDRRHIQDADVFLIKRKVPVPLNLEMSVASEIVKVALRLKPAKACLVPEKRKELTTEGGLDVVGGFDRVKAAVSRLRKTGVEVSLFIDPEPDQIDAAVRSGADFIELHTGVYAREKGKKRAAELARLKQAALFAHSLGLGVNAGHGLNYENVKPIAHLPHIQELNIGHSIVARSVFVGIRQAVCDMVRLIK